MQTNRQTDGQTDIKRLIFVFYSFAIASKEIKKQ